nr:MAG TPA: hypothetical protein [Crassvirales sp.]
MCYQLWLIRRHGTQYQVHLLKCHTTVLHTITFS